jgi:hypothetical protein
MPEHDAHRGFLLAFQKIEHRVRGDNGAGAGEVDGAGVRYPPCANGRTTNGWRNTTKRATKRRPAAEKSPVISARNGGMGGFPSPAPSIFKDLDYIRRRRCFRWGSAGVAILLRMSDGLVPTISLHF